MFFDAVDGYPDIHADKREVDMVYLVFHHSTYRSPLAQRVMGIRQSLWNVRGGRWMNLYAYAEFLLWLGLLSSVGSRRRIARALARSE